MLPKYSWATFLQQPFNNETRKFSVIYGYSAKNSLNELTNTSKSVDPLYMGAPRSKFDFSLLYYSNSANFYECCELLEDTILEGNIF